MGYVPSQAVYDGITAACLQGYDEGLSLVEILELAWQAPDFPMHCPEHHYLAAGALLAVYRRLAGDGRALLAENLMEAEARAKNVLGGFCGLYGACGAAVGAGIFHSVYADTTPYSRDGWDRTTGITAHCLEKISALGGPRCCKRVCYTAMLAAAGFMKESYGLDAAVPERIRCTRYEQNNECLRGDCPYFPAEA